MPNNIMIEGIVVTPLRRFVDERGTVMHMMRNDAPPFREFGEVYFSTIHPGAVKAWHLHYRKTLNYAVPSGRIKFVLHDDRADSPSRGVTQEIFMGVENYVLVTVPPMVWNGFKCIGDTTALVVNCATIPYDPTEIVRRDPFDKVIGYDWGIRHG